MARVDFFMVVFASQRNVNWPRFSHTFGAFAAAVNGTKSLIDGAEVIGISWLPKTLDIQLNSPPEPGNNFGLTDTLDWAENLGARISAWGPYQIKKELYDKVCRRVTNLKSGSIQYVVRDGPYRPDRATNCIHGLSDLGLTARLLQTGAAHGERASAMVVRYFRPWILDAGESHSEVVDLFHLKDYRIVVRNS